MIPIISDDIKKKSLDVGIINIKHEQQTILGIAYLVSIANVLCRSRGESI